MSGWRTWWGRLSLVGTGVRWQRQTRRRNCVQTVLAMVFDVDPAVIERALGTPGTVGLDDTMALLAQLGVDSRPIAARLVADWWSAFFQQGGGRRLRGVGCVMPKNDQEPGHAVLMAGPVIYDPASHQWFPATPEILRRLDWIIFLPPDFTRTTAVRAARRQLRALH